MSLGVKTKYYNTLSTWKMLRGLTLKLSEKEFLRMSSKQEKKSGNSKFKKTGKPELNKKEMESRYINGLNSEQR